MSPSSPPAADQSMRQQLDELDTLLQRMLALPINQIDDPPPAPDPQPPRRPPAPAPARPPVPSPPASPVVVRRTPSMILLSDSSPVPPPPEPPAHLDPAYAFNLNPLQGSSILGHRSPAASALRPPVNNPSAPPVWLAEATAYNPIGQSPMAPEPPAQLSAQPTQSQVQPVAAPEAVSADSPPSLPQPAYRYTPPPPAPLVLRPLVWVNRLFDDIVIHFGPPGRWLRSPAGRTCLGSSGLLMLAGSAAWGALGWFGWTW